VFLRSLKLIDTVPDGLELHELEIYLEAALPITYRGSALGIRQRASAGNGCGLGISLARGPTRRPSMAEEHLRRCRQAVASRADCPSA